MDTGAVSRCNLSRSQEFVLVQNFDYLKMSVSGFNSHNEFVLLAGAKAKTVTSQLTHIVRVIFRPGLKVSDIDKLSR